MALTVVASIRRSIFTGMAEVLGHIRALGTVVLAAAALLCAEADAKAPRRHAPPPALQSRETLDEGLTSAEPPLPTLRPAALSPRFIGPPVPDHLEATLDQGLTSQGPPLPGQRPDAAPSRDDVAAGPPAPDGKEPATLDEGLTSTKPPPPTPRPAALSPRFIGPPSPDRAEAMLDQGLTSEEPPFPISRPGKSQSDEFIGPPAPAAPAPKPPPPRPAVPPEKMAECLGELQRLGVEFTPQPPITDPTGCAVQNPVAVSRLGTGIKVTPAALLDCPMAVAAARFMTEIAKPEAKRDLGSDLVSINNASGYVCRPRHGQTTMSEHAYGNALDVAGFGLADGHHIDVKADGPETEEKFLDAVRKAACGPFKTVLGPGSDADHALHLHFDLEPRRNGGTFCQ
jgi:hypothetical protein